MICTLCDKEFKQTQGKNRTRCSPCTVKIRRYRCKEYGIAYLGGKCVDCGFAGHQSAFDFHHLRDKSFALGNIANKSWEFVKPELDKCVLLCRNCHSIRHSTRDDPRLIAAASTYRGKGFDGIVGKAF